MVAAIVDLLIIYIYILFLKKYIYPNENVEAMSLFMGTQRQSNSKI